MMAPALASSSARGKWGKIKSRGARHEGRLRPAQREQLVEAVPQRWLSRAGSPGPKSLFQMPPFNPLQAAMQAFRSV